MRVCARKNAVARDDWMMSAFEITKAIPKLR
jgi:hypothetical protein